MIPEIGYFSLILALCFSGLQAIFPMMGAQTHRTEWMKSAHTFAIGQWLCVLLAMSCLFWSFISNDFSLQYVAANSNTLLPTIYKFCALWGAHEGSMLLWLFFLSSWMVFLLLFWKKYPLPFIARALAILGILSLGFLIFLLWTSDPFTRVFLAIPQEGRDLNPLLQDPGLVSHPPMLYAGYVGFSVPFAFALSSLMSPHLEKSWASFARPYTLLAWGFLTIGIVLGSWWAYRQLGWGGWWFWDPVENASFMPWLAGVILIHSLIVLEKRQLFNAWAILIAIIAFSLSLLGTFIVRSGVLISVHAFAVDPKRGLFILLFLIFVVGGALTLYAFHAKRILHSEKINFFSKETFLLLNNIFLFAALMTVLLGTLYPLIIQVLSLGRLSVGAPYFNKSFGFLMLPILFLMAAAPLVHWKDDSFSRIKKRFGWMLLISLTIGLALSYIFSKQMTLLVFIAMSLAAWIFLNLLQVYKRPLVKPYYARPLSKLAVLSEVGGGTERKTGAYLEICEDLSTVPTNKFTSTVEFRKRSNEFVRRLGMILAHGGIAICLLGIVLSTAYTETADVKMSLNDRFELSGYQFQLLNVHEVKKKNYDAQEANIAITSAGKFLGYLKPQIRFYKIQSMALPKAAINASVFRDIYITFSELLDKDVLGFRFSVKPFIRWIWAGGILMACGGVISAIQIILSYRRKKR